MTRILVCGGRDYNDRETVFATLDEFHRTRPIGMLIYGMAPGADRIGSEWAIRRGVSLNGFRADWQRHGRAAGPIRNQEMLDKGRPHVVIAFPGGRGTADMIRRARAAGVEVQMVTDTTMAAPQKGGGDD